MAALNEDIDSSLNPLESSEETAAPYVHKKQQLSTTATIQGNRPNDTHVPTPATTTPMEANFLSNNSFYFSYLKPEDHKMKINDDMFFFNAKKNPICNSSYAVSDYCPFIWSPTNISMCTFGSTMDSKDTCPYWKYNNNHVKHLMPKLLESCRHTYTATEQGHTLLHDKVSSNWQRI
eukprot:817785-Ditylum_brightwellii.AAC.1